MSLPLADDRPIRILHVIDTLGVGGAQALLPLLARNLDARRFLLHVCALGGHPDSPVTQALRDAGVRVSVWQARALLDPRQTLDLIRLIRNEHIDVVHAHLLYSSIQTSVAAALCRVPLVVTLHSVWSLEHRWASLKRPLHFAALRFSHARVIAVADEIRREYLAAGVGPNNITVIPNGIDIEPFQDVEPSARDKVRAELLGGSEGPLLVSVGRIATPKAYPDLVAAFAKTLGRFPDARLAIVGRLSGGTDALKASIEHFGIADRVSLTDIRSDIPTILAAADIFVSSSIREGVPLAVLEALAAGLPVVATRVGGVPEVIEDGYNGILVPPARPDQLADALLALLSSPERMEQLVKGGRERIKLYSAQTWANRLAAEYNHAVRSGRGAGGHSRSTSLDSPSAEADH